MNDYYTDEPIGWDDADLDGERWDYVEPDAASGMDAWDGDWLQPEDITVPEPIRRLQEMISRQPWQITMEKSFYEQALMMADYTDDADVVMFHSYFPTYRDMTVAQMRSYFTLRRMWRQGKYIDAPLSYIFVYVYELLMQVGVASAEEGYQLLVELQRAYGGPESGLDNYLRRWLRDYVVYYNLSAHFDDVFAAEQATDREALQLASYKTATDQRMVDIVCAVGNYDIRHKQLFIKRPSEATSAIAFVLRQVLRRMEQQSHHRIETLCLGMRRKRQLRMFDRAVFYDPSPVMNAEISVSPRHSYYCRNGLWSRDEYEGDTRKADRLMGGVVREIDRQLRPLLGVRPQLKAGKTTSMVSQWVADALAQWVQLQREERQRREAERRRVSIDFSQLGRIRSDADVVMQALTDGDEAEPQEEPQASEPTPAPEPTAEEPQGVELQFLRLVLQDGDWAKFLRDHHTPEGVMVETINNRAMDELGDIVLEDNGDGLHIIPDYEDDVRRVVEGRH